MDSENTPPQFRNIKAHIGEQTLSLPEEIIEEILSRLPVKSLLKFRCVSKSWRCLIGSQRFIKTHLQNSTKNTTFAYHRIILNSIHERLVLCSLRSLLNEPFTVPFTYDSVNVGWKSVCLVGCCNGVVCILLDGKDFILWNPSTTMTKKLPNIDGEVKYGDITNYGFGCDELSGDYKVFVICSVVWITRREQAICKLYSLKTNSWKIIMNDGDVSPFDARGKFASGKLHWKRIYNWDSRFGRDIVSFDLKSEVYRMVEQPSYSEGGFYPSLGVLGGCLCVLCDYEKTHLDVWVMKQYGVKESWDKVVTVSHLHDPRPFSTLFAIGPNGEILLIYGSTFLICPKDNVFQHPCKINLDPDSFREADVYVESLVSLIPNGE